MNFLNEYPANGKASTLDLILIFSSGNLYHEAIALNFITDNSGDKITYKLKFLDPNGPLIRIADCQKYQPSPTSTNKVLKCSTLDRIPLSFIVSAPTPNSDKAKSLILLNQNSVRSNTSHFLSFDYPLISNSLEVFNGGVCAAWSNFVLRVAYLGEFVGECASTPTAEVPVNNLASTGLLSFFDLLFKDFLKPFINY